ncbi:NACHT domain-containing protein [Vibrio parahaemolyticus]|uniref:NACHT domain-containing protein n=1 Tax=Vibrio parahaemolyticus TaxID=670 RepID=UPI0008710839|nr:NACHT domain-containing protein [Vibrio parahaemolyticus]AOV89766.1 Putative NTPase (NACHT family) [Vibrio parahaemolyticus]
MDASLLQSKHKLILFLFVFSVLIITSSYYISGLYLSLLSTLFMLGFMKCTSSVWLPYKNGKNNVRKYSLYLTLLVSVPFLNPSINEVLVELLWKPFFLYLSNNYSVFSGIKIPDGTPSVIVIPFVVLIVFIVNYFMRDKTIMGNHPREIEKEFPERKYHNQLMSFSNTLKIDLDKTDNETNWSAELFTPLDAEVEIVSGYHKKKKVTDLIKAIRSDKDSRVFLVLGEPGSGKSVSLRKLCADMLKEVSSTGRVPVYVNLREWVLDSQWDESNPPNVAQLQTFIINNLTERLDVFGKEFVDEYFKKMIENGRVFFILDSFDEIPAVLDVDERSWLIKELSSTIYTFLAGTHESRGILSSRVFRKPTENFKADTVLEIRPFTEMKISLALKKYIRFNEDLTSEMFKEKNNFISIASNPFASSLISLFCSDNGGKLPETQSDLYESYINKRLDSANDKLRKKGLTKSNVLQCTQDIALSMFSNQRFGLGAPIEELERLMPEYNIKDVVDVLTYVRLGRLGDGDEQLFSFAHRRFNEYFVAKGFIDDKSLISIESIPTDSRWRDAMVMYCEIAPKEEALRIARFCWDNIEQASFDTGAIDRGNYLRSIHCLRFLKDAFRTRKDCLVDFIDDLNNLIKGQVENDNNIVTQKIVVESVLLLEEVDIDHVVSKALSNQSSWVRDEAFRACRNLSEISNSLSNKLLQYVYHIDDISLFKKFGEINFSLSLSSAFGKLRKLLCARVIFNYMFLLGCLISILIDPIIVVLYASLFFVHYFVIYFSIITKGDFTNFRGIFTSFIIKFNGFFVILLWLSKLTSDKEGDRVLYYQNMVSSEVVTYVLFLSVALMVPYFELYVLTLSIKRMTLKRMVYGVLGTLCTGGGVLLLFFSFKELMLMIPEVYKAYLILVLSVLVGSVIFIPVLKNLYGLYQDHKKLKRSHLPKTMNREDVCGHLDLFKTAWGQKIFLNHLDIDRIKLVGSWPEVGFPKCNCDTNRSILAKIEERNLS